MKHSIKLLTSELNKYCDYYQIKKEYFDKEMESRFCRSYRSKFNFFYSDMERIKKDFKKIIGIEAS